MKKIIILGLVVAIIAIFMVFDLGQYLTLTYIKSQQVALQDFYQQNTALTILGFLGIYIIVTGASLPGAAIMTLAGGAIFGLVTGVIIASFASSIGATLAFLVSRFVLRDSVQSKFGNNLKAINEGIEKDGAFYLFALRLVPAFPFFVINMVMGLTGLKTWTFYWVSQLGMLAGTIVYVNAG
ncbi:MAG: TVP38/TMEM64 family protein, partial [Thiotrichaceae bacterium]|nr:TVP38/TMEM64 family protein [Thiotrichaceae bacterium]